MQTTAIEGGIMQGMWSERDLVYFAGFFDGEGSIIIHKRAKLASPSGQTRPHQLRVCLSNTDRPIMQWVLKSFGGYLFEKEPRPPRSRYWKWTVQSRAAGELLQALVPYLRVKKREALVAIRFQKNVTDWKVRGHRKGVRGQLAVPPRMLAFRDRLADRLRSIRAERVAA